MNSLIWKQWRESKGLLAIFVVWMILAVCYAIGYELGHPFRAIVGSFSGLTLFYSYFAAITLAMRTTRGEHTSRTIAFSAALPVSIRRMATVRLVGAILTLSIPIVIAASMLSFALASGIVEQAMPRNSEAYVQLLQRDTAPVLVALEQLWSVTAISILAGVELLLVLCLLGNYLRSQAQIGFLAAVLAVWALLAAGLLWHGRPNPYAQLAFGAVMPQSLVIHWGYGEEHGEYSDHELANYRWLAMALAIPLFFMIGRSFVNRYGAMRSSLVSTRRRFRAAMPPLLSRVPIPLPSRTLAMIWLELRQSLPLATFGLLLALLVSVAGVMLQSHQPHAATFGPSVLKEMPHSTAFLAMLWSVVVGSSLYAADLGSGLGNFWRSRPISPVMWFWTKFVIGLVAVLAVLDGVTILISWSAPRDAMTSGMSWAYVACFPILHALMYALAVLGTCAFRRPVIGGIVAILGYGVLTTVITSFPLTDQLEPIHIYNALLSAERAEAIDITQHNYRLVYGVHLTLVVGFAMLSARLARPLEPSRCLTRLSG